MTQILPSFVCSHYGATWSSSYKRLSACYRTRCSTFFAMPQGWLLFWCAACNARLFSSCCRWNNIKGAFFAPVAREVAPVVVCTVCAHHSHSCRRELKPHFYCMRQCGRGSLLGSSAILNNFEFALFQLQLVIPRPQRRSSIALKITSTFMINFPYTCIRDK